MSASDAVTDSLNRMRAEFRDLPGGRPADYIPQLGLADPDAFGLALVSMDGHCYSAGEADMPFTIQSVSKPFIYALALSLLGLDEVSRWVGAEPSGDAFNAISLEPGTGRPANAMVNAGAIVTTALIPDAPTNPPSSASCTASAASPGVNWRWTRRCSPPRRRPVTATGRSPT